MLMRCVVAWAVHQFLFEPKNHDLAGALPQLPILKKKKKGGKRCKRHDSGPSMRVPNDAS